MYRSPKRYVLMSDWSMTTGTIANIQRAVLRCGHWPVARRWPYSVYPMWMGYKGGPGACCPGEAATLPLGAHVCVWSMCVASQHS